jgi:hypothetical protein
MTDNGNFYRSNCIGVSLIAVLNELIQKKEISAEEATTILVWPQLSLDSLYIFKKNCHDLGLQQKSYDEEFAKELRSHMVIKKDLIFHDGEVGERYILKR